MSTYYYYYLDCKTDEGWHRLSNPRSTGSDDSSLLFWHSGHYGSAFTDHYEMGRLPFDEFCKEMQDKYREAHAKVQAGASRWDAYYPDFYQLDLAEMNRDFADNIHEYDGIITRNSLLKLRRDSEYNPNTIEVADFNNLPSQIQENYVFHAWDSPWSEYGYVYEIMPIVIEIMKQHHLSLDNIRLTFCLC